MTRTAAAADAALPSDRRNFIGSSLALASLVTASAAMPAAAAENPDAVLTALGREWEAAVLRQNALSEDIDAAFDRYDEPPRPEAVYKKLGDDRLFPHIRGDAVFGGTRLIYQSAKSLDYVRQRGYGWPGNEQTEYGRSVRARADEIFAAHDAWDAECERRRIDCGLNAVVPVFQRETEVVNDLEWRVAKTAACTTAGLAIKARVSLWALCNSTADLEQEWRIAVEKHESPLGDNTPICDLLTTSLLLDLLHMNGVTHPAKSAVRA